MMNNPFEYMPPDTTVDKFRSSAATAARLSIQECPQLDALVEAAAELMHAPIAIISLVERGHQYFAATVGLEQDRTPRDYSFCSYAVLANEPLEIPDALRDDRFRDHPLVTSEPNIRYYLGIPICDENGWPLGTICVFDRRPRIPAKERKKKVLKRLARAAEAVIRQQRELLALRSQTQHARHHLDEISQVEGPSSWGDAIPSILELFQPVVRERGVDVRVAIGKQLGEILIGDSAHRSLSLVIQNALAQSDDSGRFSVSVTAGEDVVSTFLLLDSLAGISPGIVDEMKRECRSHGHELDIFHHAGGVLEVRFVVQRAADDSIIHALDELSAAE